MVVSGSWLLLATQKTALQAVGEWLYGEVDKLLWRYLKHKNPIEGEIETIIPDLCKSVMENLRDRLIQ